MEKTSYKRWKDQFISLENSILSFSNDAKNPIPKERDIMIYFLGLVREKYIGFIERWFVHEEDLCSNCVKKLKK